jgi:hypothetical protein
MPTIHSENAHHLHDSAWVLAITLAAHRHGSAQNFFASAGQVLGTAAGPHDASNLDHIRKGDAAGVLDVLLLRCMHQKRLVA